MGYKAADGRLVDACLDKVKPGEHIFVLRAQDLSAPAAIRRWAAANEKTLSREKFLEAFDTARRMEIWASLNGGKYPD